MGGKSSSSSSTTNTTNNLSVATDNRLAIGPGSIGASSGGTVNYSSTNISQDPGALRAMELAMLSSSRATSEAIKASQNAAAEAQRAAAAQAAAAQAAAAAASAQAAQTSSDAFGFAKTVDASNKVGFSKLLDTSFDMFMINNEVIGKAFDSTAKTQELTAAAFQSAQAEKMGTIDNKTIMIIAVAGAAAFAFSRRRA